jgi:hypothetical protein
MIFVNINVILSSRFNELFVGWEFRVRIILRFIYFNIKLYIIVEYIKIYSDLNMRNKGEWIFIRNINNKVK